MGTTPCDRLWKSLHGGGSSFALPELHDAAAAAAESISLTAPERAGLTPKQTKAKAGRPAEQEIHTHVRTRKRKRKRKREVEIDGDRDIEGEGESEGEGERGGGQFRKEPRVM